MHGIYLLFNICPVFCIIQLLLGVYFTNLVPESTCKRRRKTMTEKTVSKYLLNLEKHFTNDNPVLLKAAKIFHELDQLEFDLGLLNMEDTTAAKNSWWPIVSLIGGNSTAKSKFLNNYLGTDQLASGIQTAAHKFTVLLHNNQANSVTLPGTALDVDHRYPFYQISQKIEQQQKGEGSRINAYLELKTIHSDKLKGKLFVDTPNMGASQINPIDSLLTRHVIENSDLVLVFTDVFDTITPLVNELIQQIVIHQDSNKFVFITEQAPGGFITPANSHDIVAATQRKLYDLGINAGQFIALASQQNLANFTEIDQRMENVDHDRSYRVLNYLEQSIHDLEDVAIAEVRKDMAAWKERSNMSSLIIVGFITFLAILVEIQVGLLEFLLDPIIGPIIVIALVGIMLPLHLMISRVQAKFIMSRLATRQKQLHLTENLASLFEKNLTIGRIILPVSEPAGWNKKTKARLAQLLDKTKELVQSLNDDFGSYDEQSLKEYLDSIQ